MTERDGLDLLNELGDKLAEALAELPEELGLPTMASRLDVRSQGR